MNGPAQTAFATAVSRYSADLLAEASRLEAATNTSGTAELTSTMVQDADLLLRRGYAKRRKSRLLVCAQIVSAVGGWLTGVLTNGNVLKTPLGLGSFVVVLTVTLTALLVAVMKEH